MGVKFSDLCDSSNYSSNILNKKKIKTIHGVDIYELSGEVKTFFLFNLISDLILKYDKEEYKEITISAVELIEIYLPLLTSIEIDIEDQEEINRIISNPPDKLIDIIDEIKVMMEDVAYEIFNLFEIFLLVIKHHTNNMSNEQKKKYFEGMYRRFFT